MQDLARKFCKLLSLGVFAIMLYYCFVSSKIYYIMHENSNKNHNLTDLPKFHTICIMPVAAALLLRKIKCWIIHIMRPHLVKYCKDQDNPEKLEQRVTKVCDLFYKEIFYLTSTITGYLIMKDSPVLPYYLGGSGSMKGIFDGMPY